MQVGPVPMGINPQAYSTLLSMDRANDALDMILKDAPFPRVLGYVCHAPCEKKCKPKPNRPVGRHQGF